MIKEVVLCRLKDRSKIDSITNCWLFVGCLTDGYGIMRVDSIQWGVHRLSAWIYLDYDLTNKTKQTNHKLECKNRHCWNPDHIYIGTQFENVMDSIKTGTHHFVNPFND